MVFRVVMIKKDKCENNRDNNINNKISDEKDNKVSEMILRR